MTTRVAAGLTFECGDPIAEWRVDTIRTKEPGTVAWIETLQPGEVFYDVGANIGLYTLLAARRVGPAGRVYAFEPHVANALALLRNVQANGFSDRVRVLTCALHSRDGGLRFNYRSLREGSSGSQLGHCEGEDGREFQPVVAEIKPMVTICTLLVSGTIRPPTAIKIDVDGNELEVLRGIFPSRTHQLPARTMQVEMHPRDRQAITDLLIGQGYRIDRVHFTAQGQQAIDRGADAASVTNNTIFRQEGADAHDVVERMAAAATEGAAGTA